jgi:hypothetical protein
MIVKYFVINYDKVKNFTQVIKKLVGAGVIHIESVIFLLI